jgi:hypothetical protein
MGREDAFEIKNAIAAEQTRILTADLYKRVLLKEGVPLREINSIAERSFPLLHLAEMLCQPRA